MSPKQKKIAAKAPPPDKIDAKDFAVLKAEKAKGRGMGLQDEKVKPGKVMKANKGKSIDTKAFKKTIGVMPTIDKAFPRLKADPTKPISSVAPKVTDALKKKKLPGRIGTALGVASMLVPAAYAAAKQYKDYKSAKNRDKAKVKKYSVGGGADMSRKNKKSKSGSSVKDIFKSYGKYDGKPIELSIGGGVEKAKEHKKIIKDKAGTALGYIGEMAKTLSKATPAGSALETTKKVAETIKNKKEQKRIGRFEDRIQMPESTGRPKPTLPGRPMPFPLPGRPRDAKPMPDVPGRKRDAKPMPDVPGRKRKAIPLFGGGMMKPMGYKSGTMVKARGCKLGRSKPTKMY